MIVQLPLLAYDMYTSRKNETLWVGAKVQLQVPLLANFKSNEALTVPFVNKAVLIVDAHPIILRDADDYSISVNNNDHEYDIKGCVITDLRAGAEVTATFRVKDVIISVLYCLDQFLRPDPERTVVEVKKGDEILFCSSGVGAVAYKIGTYVPLECSCVQGRKILGGDVNFYYESIE